MNMLTLMRAAHRGLSRTLGSEAWEQSLKERARNREACCLMDGFLLSITARTSSDRFCRVVCKHRGAQHQNPVPQSSQQAWSRPTVGLEQAGNRLTVRKMASMASWRAWTT